MSPRRRTWTLGGLGLALLAAAYAAAALFLVSLRARRAQLLQLEQWFDPLFFEYNVVLLLIAQLLVPAVTLMYVRRMKGEKERRLRRAAEVFLARNRALAELDVAFEVAAVRGRRIERVPL